MKVNLSRDLSKWMFFNCPKDFAWIIYQNLSEILSHQTEFSLKKEDLLYVHSVYMTQEKLICLLEAKDGYYLIENLKQTEENSEATEPNSEATEPNSEATEANSEPEPNSEPINKVRSQVKRYSNLGEFERATSRSNLNLLGIKKLSLRKLTQEQKNQTIFPYDYSQVEDVTKLLNQELNTETGHLDLLYNFGISSENLFQWDPKYLVQELTLHTCCGIRDFKWLSADWVKDVRRLNLINLNQIINRNIEFLVHKMPKLTELYVHQCPQINIKTILGALKPNQLEILCLNDYNMACQPNQYSGLITEDEWDLFRNRSVKKLFINSGNLSLDIIDYLKQSCLVLENLIIDHGKYKYLKENLLTDPDPNCQDGINIVSTGGVKMRLPRDFKIRNLLKHRYSKPFSDSMLKVMERIYQEEQD